MLGKILADTLNATGLFHALRAIIAAFLQQGKQGGERASPIQSRRWLRVLIYAASPIIVPFWSGPPRFAPHTRRLTFLSGRVECSYSSAYGSSSSPPSGLSLPLPISGEGAFRACNPVRSNAEIAARVLLRHKWRDARGREREKEGEAMDRRTDADGVLDENYAAFFADCSLFMSPLPSSPRSFRSAWSDKLRRKPAPPPHPPSIDTNPE